MRVREKLKCPLCKRKCVCYEFRQTSEVVFTFLKYRCKRCGITFTVAAKNLSVEGKEIIFGEMIGIDHFKWSRDGCQDGSQDFNPSSRDED